MPPFRKGASSWGITVEGLPQLRRAFKALEEFDDLPYARAALERVQDMAVREINQRAPGSLKGKATGYAIKGEGTSMKAPVRVAHPAAKSTEFGREWWYRGFTGRAQKRTGKRFKSSPGLPARPFIGIKAGGHAIGAIAPKAAEIMAEALAKEWQRLAGEST